MVYGCTVTSISAALMSRKRCRCTSCAPTLGDRYTFFFFTPLFSLPREGPALAYVGAVKILAAARSGRLERRASRWQLSTRVLSFSIGALSPFVGYEHEKRGRGLGLARE